MSTSTPKTYEGNCHCRAVQYTATLPEALAPEGTGKIYRCNCSVCTKSGYYLVYPKVEDVEFKDGSDAKLKAYQFGNKIVTHRFCGECGSSVFIDFKDMPPSIEHRYGKLGMNASLFKGIDLEHADIEILDGKNELEPKYED